MKFHYSYPGKPSPFSHASRTDAAEMLLGRLAVHGLVDYWAVGHAKELLLGLRLNAPTLQQY